jgi:hypothetical protein
MVPITIPAVVKPLPMVEEDLAIFLRATSPNTTEAIPRIRGGTKRKNSTMPTREQTKELRARAEPLS